MRNWFLILFASSLIIFACNETIPIGTEVLPDTDDPDNIFSDTTTILSWTIREDSLRSDKLFNSQLGYMNDPIFGHTDASLLMGFRIPNSGASPSLLDTTGGYYLDSVVLSLMISSVYGDTNLPMSFTIYKLSSPLNTNQAYYSTMSFPQGMLPVGRVENYRVKPGSSYDEDTTFADLGAQMRLKLDPFLGQSLINIIDTELLTSNDRFHQYLPGLIIVPDEIPGSMIEIDMLTNTVTTSRLTALQDSRLQLYYKNGQDSVQNIIFPATILNLGINKFDHDYASTNVETALMSNDPEGDAVNYIQGLSGVKTKIEFPHINTLGEDVGVLKAELVITRLADGSDDLYPAPDRIYALKIDEDGGNENISDFSTLPAGHFGGFGQEVTLDNGEAVFQYRINISDYLQRIIFGQEPNNGMFLTIYSDQNSDITAVNASDLTPNRIVIGGGANTVDEYRLKLDLTYTLFD